MGWITKHSNQICLPNNPPSQQTQTRSESYSFITDPKPIPSVNHIERLPASTTDSLEYPFLPLSTADSDLPYIPTSSVTTKQYNPNDRLWIVVDSIVYDCSDFLSSHPGGPVVIQSFLGQDCSWQFWRFHGKEHIANYGRQLRVGRTGQVENRFCERLRWVGRRRLWNAVDDD